MRISYKEREQEIGTRRMTVTFEEPDQELMRAGSEPLWKESFSGESDVEESASGDREEQRGKFLSGEFKWMFRSCTSESAVETCSTAHSSVSSSSKKSEINTYSDSNSSAESDLSELAIHPLLVETPARDLDREVYLDPDSDRYLVPSEKVFDNAADDLETKAVWKHSMRISPQKEVVRTDLQPFKQDTEPMAKIWCVKMKDDAHQPDELNSHLRVKKTYLKARYRLSDLIREL